MPVWVDEPLTLTLASEKRPEAAVELPDGSLTSVALRQDPQLPWQWSAVYWPRLEGWHRFVAGEATAAIYVYPERAWRSVRQAGATLATRRHAETTRRFDEAVRSHPMPWELPMQVFFVLFLVSSAFLWLERKL